MKPGKVIFGLLLAAFIALIFGWLIWKITSVDDMRLMLTLIVGIETFILESFAFAWSNGTRGSIVIRMTGTFVSTALFVVNAALAWWWPNEVAVVFINGIVMFAYAAAAFKVYNSGE